MGGRSPRMLRLTPHLGSPHSLQHWAGGDTAPIPRWLRPMGSVGRGGIVAALLCCCLLGSARALVSVCRLLRSLCSVGFDYVLLSGWESSEFNFWGSFLPTGKQRSAFAAHLPARAHRSLQPSFWAGIREQSGGAAQVLLSPVRAHRSARAFCTLVHPTHTYGCHVSDRARVLHDPFHPAANACTRWMEQ